MYSARIRTDGNFAVTALWGRNVESGHGSDSALTEATVDLDGSNVPFARLEYVQKLGHDLVLPGDPGAKYDIFQAQLGFVRRFTGGPVVPFVGVTVDVGLVPASLEGVYGTRVPVGAFFFFGVQPPRATATHMHGTGM
jgi:hypothetical protein